MPIVSVDPEAPDPAIIDRAAAVLKRGGLVAFPTETVYGVGAHALDPAAVQRIYAAKGRPSFNPLIVHVGSEAAARELAGDWPELASRLARAFWPGPLTLVVRKRSIVPDAVTAGLDSVALRVPAHPVALALIRAAAIPIAAPSANRSTELSPTSARHVAQSLGDRVDLLLDGGDTMVGIESTVLDLRGRRPAVLRPGIIGVQELEPVVGELAPAGEARGGEAPRASPGLLDRHYAPRARVELFDPAHGARAATEAAAEIARGLKVGAMLLEAELPAVHPTLRMPRNPRGYARRLYAALHELDDAGCAVVFVEKPPNDERWMAITDRLRRAATPA
jgi:L-threonylcarbamoyladenylate synthase